MKPEFLIELAPGGSDDWSLRSIWKPLATATVLSIAGANSAWAQHGGETPSTPGERTTPVAAATAEGVSAPQLSMSEQSFDLPAGDLADALAAYSRATHVRVKFTLPAGNAAGLQAQAVHGSYTTSEALKRVLEGTGLEARFEGPGRVEIGIVRQEHVEVNGSVAETGLQQFAQPLLDTAQTVSVVPQYIMSEQADTTLRDSLRNVPGISIAAGEGGAQGDNLTIRGFSARNDIYLDGIRDFGSYYRDSFNYDAVDVLEGPASVEFGRGSTGGVVNQESKVPTPNRFLGGAFQFGTNALRRGSIDLNQPLGAIPGGTAFRMNAAAIVTGVAGRDVTLTRRFGIAPSLTFGLNTATRFTVSYLREPEDSIPDYGLPYFGLGPIAVPRTTYYGLASANYLQTTPDVVTARLDHDVNAFLTVRNTLRWGNYSRKFRITEPLINSVGTLSYLNADGRNVYEGTNTQVRVQCAVGATPAASCYSFNTPLEQVYLRRNEISGFSVEDILWDQVSGTARFNLGPVANNAVVLLEGGRERSNPNRPTYTMPYIPALNPNPNDAFAPTATTNAVTTHVASQSFGVNFLDTLTLTRWLQVSGGVRFDYFNTYSSTPVNTLNATPVAASSASRLDRQPTYRAAVVFKPRPAGSVYFDWGTSFNPAAESLSLSANNALSAPEYNETFELGAKWSYLHDRLSLNGSVFRTEKLNARETDPNNSNNIINAGNQLVRGLQIGALGHMPSHFDLIAGYAFLDGRVESSVVNGSPFAAVNTAFYTAWQTALKTNPAAAIDPRYNTAPFYLNPAGFPLANVPRNSGNLWVTHRLPFRFTGGFGGSYVGARRASSTTGVAVYNNASVLDPGAVPVGFKAIPGYTLLNLMVSRPVTENISFQANVNNLTNKFFIDLPHPGHLVPGEGLNAQFGMSYKF